MAARRLTRLDWIVALDTVVILALVILHPNSSTLPGAAFVRFTLAYTGVSCVILIVWMLRGGAESSLWNWLPPFWPISRGVPSSEGRWLVVLAMVAGAVVGGTLQFLRQ
jgi:hypothetical protein